MVSPVIAMIMVRTDTPQMAPPITSKMGSPAIGLAVTKKIRPPDVKTLNAASTM